MNEVVVNTLFSRKETTKSHSGTGLGHKHIRSLTKT